jgi:hypothetical protein
LRRLCHEAARFADCRIGISRSEPGEAGCSAKRRHAGALHSYGRRMRTATNHGDLERTRLRNFGWYAQVDHAEAKRGADYQGATARMMRCRPSHFPNARLMASVCDFVSSRDGSFVQKVRNRMVDGDFSKEQSHGAIPGVTLAFAFVPQAAYACCIYYASPPSPLLAARLSDGILRNR